MRAYNGTITSFDVGTNGTWGASVNSAGQIAGYYIDATNATKGFVRFSNGAITTFSVPGAATAYGESINDLGDVAGFGYASDNQFDGFVRAGNGTFTTFDVLGAAHEGTAGYGINNKGDVTGYYVDTR